MIAFIPIKNHSERVSGKNFRKLGEKPLYSWIIESLLQIREVEEIVIDTDSEREEIWHLDANQRITVKRRESELVGDFVSVNSLIWSFLRDRIGEHVLMTHVTNPFLSSLTIETGIDQYKQNLSSGINSLFSVTRFQGRFYDKSLTPINHNKDSLTRTQDLEPIFLENSCLYIFSHESFFESKSRIGTRPIEFETPLIESLDIDTQEDWNLAELIAKSYDNHPNF